MSLPQFFFDTADTEEIRRVWDSLEPHINSRSCLGITTNPNALSKINCSTLSQLEKVIPTLCKLTTELRNGVRGGVVFVQIPNSEMPFDEIFEWAQYILDFTDGTTKVGMKIPHWTRALELTDTLIDMDVEINVTGISDWATLCKAFQYPGVVWASLIPGRMEEVGLDANLHMEYIDIIRRSTDQQRVIAGSMRTIKGLRNAVVRGTVPTIGMRVWNQLMEPNPGTGRIDFSSFSSFWMDANLTAREMEMEICYPPTVTDTNIKLSKAFFEQMDDLGKDIYEEFARK